MPWHDPPLRAPGMEVLADGVHEGVRWWLQRFHEMAGFAITLSGPDGSTYVASMAQLPDADPATVKAWLVRMLVKATWAGEPAGWDTVRGPFHHEVASSVPSEV